MSTIPSVQIPPLERPEDVPDRLDALLKSVVAIGASDLHFTQAPTGLQLFGRLDGVLHHLGEWPRPLAGNVIARLKVLAELLTYRTDLPQEGRLRWQSSAVEMRLSTFPTLHGEKAVIRLFVGSGSYRFLDELQLASDILGDLRHLLAETSGVILITGPAGSGKTTTAYACLRELQREHRGSKSLVSLEDPIEAELPGVSQTQVHRPVEFTYPLGLRSLMRQDPDVIFVGEIRDRGTAETVFQAALTGHLVLTTFHAGSAAEAVTRLNDFGIEPYLLRAVLQGILCQRLFRRLCGCAVWSTGSEADRLGFASERVRQPVGCEQCVDTGYRGRLLLAELLRPQSASVARAILERNESRGLQTAAVSDGFRPLRQRAVEALQAGTLSPAEVRRVLGFREDAVPD